ncbi:hypothetical protein cym2001_15880 [Pseudomonas sp. CYM-20-01]|uniref:hypothetical protein n=1 Tax=Pseudomonas sp. CYM-20-01 TaxID=2870750 RepID=UPI002064AF4B|nr:hypothetical protein cym2001_15880 [Pseudomonas sp. CYM-20-01]
MGSIAIVVTGISSDERAAAVLRRLNNLAVRGLAYAPYADLIWCETAKPNLEEVRGFKFVDNPEFDRGVLANITGFFMSGKQYTADFILSL